MKKVIVSLCVFIICFAVTGCNKKEEKVLDKKEKVVQEEIKKEVYTTGITDIEKALEMELNLFFFRGFSKSFGEMIDRTIINDETGSLKASELDDSFITEVLYKYVSSIDSEIFNKVYSEDEIKSYLSDLYGDNYKYTHKLTASSSCASLVYDYGKEGYIVSGGCGGIDIPSTPYQILDIISKDENTITLGKAYVVPTVSDDGYEGIAPYKIYTDQTRNTLIATVDDPENLFNKINDFEEFVVTFDCENGFYHFNNLRKK